MDEAQMKAHQAALAEAEARASSAEARGYQQEVMVQEKDRGMIAEQLDMGEELERIDYLLRGFTIERNEIGDTVWTKPKTNDMVILSEYGVHLIRNTIAWYLNKNTLLSNYDEETINHKMEDFANDLNDTIFMEYEKIFQYPTLQDCKDILRDRIQKKTELKVFSRELLNGKELNSEEKKQIKDKILAELEPIIEKELEKIKQQVIKEKLKRFLLTIREIQDAIHSTYLRAWKGQERTTLRQHIHISETKGTPVVQQPQVSPNPVSWFRRH